ncbi:hypothetical protein QP481_06480 [Streptococcus oralis]|mgnify:FL=1|jgi:putative uncharacterized protein 53|uniref:hypothetical protein n=1 Tax=Streptococcus oralis TaxID=1303 RepID=UPI002050EC49|nr:hypothetical protein [Streptococcus oralis]MDU2962744.1 hypothetical protein [Streptococcus salivarius]DAM51411.1 MAG TPA: Protein of unknown function (DUF1366) [Caudoviricetes sp.]MDK7308159.1 hypothetical protein [Streptococcus oralis]MDK7311533.1 hypothetical protein [Streptococcus oralis]MDK7311591.1 hypothetical protein [Streptococcus oralis]
MAISNYELASKPYTRGLGDKTVTVVEVKLADGSRYSTNMRELAGDRTGDSDDVLIKAVLDIVKTEIDPSSAIVQAQEQLNKTKEDLTANKEYLDSVSAITEVLIALAIAQNGGMPTYAYNKVAEFIKPLVKTNRYTNGDIVAMPYPHDGNPKWPQGTQTIFKFQMQAIEGYTYKDQSLSDMLQQGVLTVVMPRID